MTDKNSEEEKQSIDNKDLELYLVLHNKETGAEIKKRINPTVLLDSESGFTYIGFTPTDGANHEQVDQADHHHPDFRPDRGGVRGAADRKFAEQPDFPGGQGGDAEPCGEPLTGVGEGDGITSPALANTSLATLNTTDAKQSVSRQPQVSHIIMQNADGPGYNPLVTEDFDSLLPENNNKTMTRKTRYFGDRPALSGPIIKLLLQRSADFTGVTIQDILAGTQKMKIAEARHFTVWLMRHTTRATYADIAHVLRRGDHTFAKHADDKIRKKRETNAAYAKTTKEYLRRVLEEIGIREPRLDQAGANSDPDVWLMGNKPRKKKPEEPSLPLPVPDSKPEGSDEA